MVLVENLRIKRSIERKEEKKKRNKSHRFGTIDEAREANRTPKTTTDKEEENSFKILKSLFTRPLLWSVYPFPWSDASNFSLVSVFTLTLAALRSSFFFYYFSKYKSLASCTHAKKYVIFTNSIYIIFCCNQLRNIQFIFERREN